MNFGLLTDPDATRFCGLRLRRLKAAMDDPTILDALLTTLEVPGQGLSALSRGKKRAAVEERIEVLRGSQTSLWYGVPAPEVFAASIFRAKALASDAVGTLFTEAQQAQDLVPAVATWMNGGGLTVVGGIPFGGTRVDIAGYRKGFLSKARAVAVQIKNDVADIKGALEDLKTFVPYTNTTYLACTPALVAEFLWASVAAADGGVARWDAEALVRALQESGSGLLLVEGDALSQALLAKERTLDAKTIEALAALIPER
jgi:hypothetical protein